jgi:hypothetical protein
MERPGFFEVVVGVLIVAGVVVIILAFAGQLAPVHAVVFAAFSAMIGWIISVQTTRRNSRKQHTMAVLMQARLSTEFNNRVRSFYAKCPLNRNVTTTDLSDPEFQQVLPDIRYLLNYYEFLAVALRHDDLDEELLRDCVRGQLCAFYEKAKVVIDDSRSSDPRGAANSTRYSELEALYRKWH